MSTKGLIAVLVGSLLVLSLAAVLAQCDGGASGGRWSAPLSVLPAAVPAPTVTITSPSANGQSFDVASQTVSGTATAGTGGAVTGVQYKLNSATTYTSAVDDSGGAWTAWHTDVTLVAGSNTIYVQALNGTAASAVVTRKITYSPPAPAPVITSPANGAIISTNPITISGTALKSTGGLSLSSVQVSIDGGAPVKASGTSSWNYKLTATPGTHTVTAQSVITATPSNLYSPASAQVTFVYAPPPTVAITNPSAATWAVDNSSFTFSGTASPANSTLPTGVPAVSEVQYRLNSTTAAWIGAAVSGDTNTWAIPVTLAAGKNTFYVRAVAGTITGATVSMTITYSPPAPAPVIKSPAGNAIISTNPITISGTAAKGTGGLSLSSVQVSIDGGTPIKASGTSSWTYKLTATTGSHSVTAQSVITATPSNLYSPWSSLATFTYAPPPTITITSPAAGPVTGGTIPVTAHLSHTVGVTSVVFKISGTQFASIPMTLPGSFTAADVTANLDTLGMSPALSGSKTLQASTTGNVATSPTVAITITNPQALYILNTSGAVNTLVQVHVKLNQTTGISGLNFTLEWDPTQLELQTNADGTARMVAGADAAGSDSIAIGYSPSAGVMNGAVTRVTSPAKAFGSGGDIAIVTFEVLNATHGALNTISIDSPVALFDLYGNAAGTCPGVGGYVATK